MVNLYVFILKTKYNSLQFSIVWQPYKNGCNTISNLLRLDNETIYPGVKIKKTSLSAPKMVMYSTRTVDPDFFFFFN